MDEDDTKKGLFQVSKSCRRGGLKRDRGLERTLQLRSHQVLFLCLDFSAQCHNNMYVIFVLSQGKMTNLHLFGYQKEFIE